MPDPRELGLTRQDGKKHAISLTLGIALGACLGACAALSGRTKSEAISCPFVFEIEGSDWGISRFVVDCPEDVCPDHDVIVEKQSLSLWRANRK